MIDATLLASHSWLSYRNQRIERARSFLDSYAGRDRAIAVLERWAQDWVINAEPPQNGVAMLRGTQRERQPGGAIADVGSLSELAYSFDALLAGGTRAEEAALAEWLLGEACARAAIAAACVGGSRALVRGQIFAAAWDVSWIAFRETLAEQCRGDAATFDRAVDLLESLIGEANSDPAAGVPQDQRESLRGYLARIRKEHSFNAALSPNPTFYAYHLEWSPLLDMVRLVDRARYLTLLERFTFLQPIEDAFAVPEIKLDPDEIVLLLNAAPAVFTDDLRNGGKTLTLLLPVLLDHVRQVVNARRFALMKADTPARNLHSEAAGEVTLARTLVNALIERRDGREVSGRWLSALIRSCVGRFAKVDPVSGAPTEDSPLRAEWFVMQALVDALGPSADFVPILESVSATEEIFALLAWSACAGATTPMSAWNEMRRRIEEMITRGSASVPAFMARTGWRSDAWPLHLLGSIWAADPNRLQNWRTLWKGLFFRRDAARHYLSHRSREDGEYSRLLAAVGIFTVGCLSAKGLHAEAADFWELVYTAAVEGWLTEPFDSGFWSHAITHLFARHPAAFAEKSPSSSSYLEELAKDLHPIVGLEDTFLSTAASLHLNGVSPEALSAAVERTGHKLATLIHDGIHLDDLAPSGSSRVLINA